DLRPHILNPTLIRTGVDGFHTGQPLRQIGADNPHLPEQTLSMRSHGTQRVPQLLVVTRTNRVHQIGQGGTLPHRPTLSSHRSDADQALLDAGDDAGLEAGLESAAPVRSANAPRSAIPQPNTISPRNAIALVRFRSP